MEGTPRQRFDGSFVLRQRQTRANVGGVEVGVIVVISIAIVVPATGHGSIPQTEQILISSRRKCASLIVPFQSTHFLSVSHIRGYNMIPTPNVMLDDQRIPSARAQPMLIPAQSTHARRMPIQTPQATFLLGIPQLDNVVIRPNGNVVTIPLISHPAHARHKVRLFPQRQQMLNIARLSFPEVHALTQRHGQDVRFAPTHQVKVVIVHELGSIQYPRGSLGDAPSNGFRHVTQSILRLGERVERRASGRIVGVGIGRGAMEDVELIMRKGIDGRVVGRNLTTEVW
mmetsp:Transcript_845/g.1759  ORF Transcript_845/g.1759 Transcript_845/m.1759 type:complete len:285 (+) Transcript_845:502-1356(+)